MAELSSKGLTLQIQTAMKSGDKQRLAVLRMLSSSLRNAEVEKGNDLSDDEALAVVAKEVRRRDEAAMEFDKVGRPEQATAEREEAAILKEWLPEQLSSDELERIVVESIEEVQASSAADVGRVMKLLMPKVRGRADGKAVSDLVKSKLS